MKSEHHILVTVLFCILLGSALRTGCASTEPTAADKQAIARKAAESNTSLGLEHMNRGQFEVALGKLKKAVAADPGYAD